MRKRKADEEIRFDDDEQDRLTLISSQMRRLQSMIDTFPNSEVDGLGFTILVEYIINTGKAMPIKQRYYPISPAIEKQ